MSEKPLKKYIVMVHARDKELKKQIEISGKDKASVKNYLRTWSMNNPSYKVISVRETTDENVELDKITVIEEPTPPTTPTMMTAEQLEAYNNARKEYHNTRRSNGQS
jgi:hypothetical protein